MRPLKGLLLRAGGSVVIRESWACSEGGGGERGGELGEGPVGGDVARVGGNEVGAVGGVTSAGRWVVGGVGAECRGWAGRTGWLGR